MKVSDLLKQYYKDPYKKNIYIYKNDKLIKKVSSYKVLEREDIDVGDRVGINALRHDFIIIKKEP